MLQWLSQPSWLTNAFLLAVLGYLAKYVNDLRLARRKDRLDRINRQLSELYGPLFACSMASGIAWSAFRTRYRPGGAFFSPSAPPTQAELEAWRAWMTEVFMPLNLRMEQAVTGHADLLREATMPQCLLDLCAHVAAYKPVLAAWAAGTYTEHTSVINFPTDVREYAEKNFKELKAEQTSLLGAR